MGWAGAGAGVGHAWGTESRVFLQLHVPLEDPKPACSRS